MVKSPNVPQKLNKFFGRFLNFLLLSYKVCKKTCMVCQVNWLKPNERILYSPMLLNSVSRPREKILRPASSFETKLQRNFRKTKSIWFCSVWLLPKIPTKIKWHWRLFLGIYLNFHQFCIKSHQKPFSLRPVEQKVCATRLKSFSSFTPKYEKNILPHFKIKSKFCNLQQNVARRTNVGGGDS